jgi:UDP-2,3-diacylglucosamine hydrolase
VTTLFISDLHLDPARPTIHELFWDFLQHRAVQAQALYILGDLFEAWIGDDDDRRLGKDVIAALRVLGDQGVDIYFVHGNRDFLVGMDFAQASGVHLLPEAQVIDLHGTPTLIMHGDTLCTDDVAYQALRAKLRSPQWQAQALGLPLAQRRQMARQLRLDSAQALRDKPEDIMDVNHETVADTMRHHGVHRLIHGHTHRPGIHELSIAGEPAQRIVLGDWYHQASVLCCDASGCRLEPDPSVC